MHKKKKFPIPTLVFWRISVLLTPEEQEILLELFNDGANQVG